MESRPFTLVAATTDPDACPEAFRSRFVMREHLDPYAESELAEIAIRAAASMALTLESTAATILAAASRGTPRRTISLLKRARDLAQSSATNHIDQATATRTLLHMGIDAAGLDPIERRALEVLRSSRRPVSAARLARLASVSLNEWLQDHELHLLNLGLLEITPRGRVAI
jgi:Holliday junction DNA helicase RuvB